MGESAADRQALMKAIKQELALKVWANPHEHITDGAYLPLFRRNPEPMWVYDVDSLEVIEVNQAAVQRYGYTRAEFLGLTIKDLRPKEDVPKFLELAHDLPTTDQTGPWRHLLKDGTVIQVLITSHSVKFGDRAARLVMAQDLALDPDSEP